MNHIALGIVGEKAAIKALKKNKYKIIETNYRAPIGEIDIIAKDGNYIVFVEVKTRSSAKFGLPREAVTEEKQRKIERVAESYIITHNLLGALMRFDVVEVLGDKVEIIRNAW